MLNALPAKPRSTPNMMRIALALLALAGSSFAQNGPQAAVRYTLELHSPGESALLIHRPEWRLRVQGERLDLDQGPAALVFEHWDDWKALDALYLDVIDCEPAVESALHPGNALVVSRPEGWDGSFDVEFRMIPLQAGSRVQQQWARLPSWTDGYSLGESRSVFPKVYQDRGEIHGTRSVQLVGPDGQPTASGWAGLHDPSQVLAIDPTRGNTFLAFGEPARERRDLLHGWLEILQYGGPPGVAGPVADLTATLASHIGKTLDATPPNPCIVFVHGAGQGGMAADPGLLVGYDRKMPEGYVHSPYYRHLVAHEFYHQWLGVRVRADESIAWFHEGFTEYLSLWHLVATGLVEPAWFANRIEELGKEARDRSTWGEIPFAAPGVQWRDGDGPRETQAYKGGAMLAFAMDVELRRRGRSDLSALVRDLLAAESGPVTLESLEAWARDQGLGTFWTKHVSGTERLEIAALLATAGFRRSASGERWEALETTAFLKTLPRRE